MSGHIQAGVYVNRRHAITTDPTTRQNGCELVALFHMRFFMHELSEGADPIGCECTWALSESCQRPRHAAWEASRRPSTLADLGIGHDRSYLGPTLFFATRYDLLHPSTTAKIREQPLPERQ